MPAFDQLRKFFAPTDSTIALPTDAFIVIDRDRAATKLGIEQRAERNGRNNYPPADSDDLDDVEQQIVADISEHAVRAQIDAATHHRIYGERLSELTLLRQLATITGASSRAISDFKTIVFNRKGKLSNAKDAVRDSYEDLAIFKREHALRRPAHVGLSRLAVFSTISLSWLFESLLNTTFLRVNDEYGLIGGFVAAAVVAAVNVGTSALAGRFLWPHAIHRSRSRKFLGLTACGIWAVLIVAWNLLAGHFRDAKAGGLPAPETMALHLLSSRPFQFDSIYSYGLLIFGIVFALVAAGTAFAADDPYPGYGSLYRRHERRCEEYSDEIQDSLEELTETRDEAIESATDVREELARQFRERGHIISAREMHRTRFRDHQSYLEEIANTLLKQYRAANVRFRSDGRVPSHFGRSWLLKRSELPTDSDWAVVDAEVVRAQKTLTDSIAEISAAYDEAIGSFDHLDKIKESLKNAS